MVIETVSRTTKIIILLVFFLFGCAGPSEMVVSEGSSPDVRLGSEIQLLDVPVKKLSAAIAQDGRAHVLAWVSKPSELYHIIVGP
jgi:hypothetical protein